MHGNNARAADENHHLPHVSRRVVLERTSAQDKISHVSFACRRHNLEVDLGSCLSFSLSIVHGNWGHGDGFPPALAVEKV